VNIAVFIDFDNIEIGVKNTLGEHFDVGTILEALKERGEVVTKIAYADWTRAGEYSRHLTQHAIRLVQRNLTPGGDKNGADINLALDALEMAFTHPHINAYVIVGGDSDFISLVEKLKQYDKQVFVVGGRSFTSHVMQRNCHEFIAYENLGGGRRSDRGGRPSSTGGTPSAIEQAMPLVRRALKVLSDREVTPQLGLLKSTLLQLDSTFSERNYGVSSFRDFAQKLANAGFVTLKENGRNVLVELKEGAATSVEASGGQAAAEGRQEPHHEPRHEPRHEARNEPRAEPRAADAIAEVRRLFQAAPNPPRWPMYVRQVKQFLRAVDPSFDERTFGFQSLNDLLRACQRDGLFRMERDRQGVMRFFQGNVMRPADGAAGGTPESEAEAQIRHGREAAAAAEAAEGEVVDGDVVQEIDAPPPVIDVASAAESGEGADEYMQGDAGPAQQAAESARPRRKRAAKGASTARPARARKSSPSKPRPARKKSE
jgi:uncharacterized LabA/DUF88 family protein